MSMSESRPFQVLDLALVFPPKINCMCEPVKNKPKLDIIPKYKDNRLEGNKEEY